MTRRKENPANAARNRRQRGYRARLEANEVKPHVLVTPEVVRTLLALGRLKEAQSKDRRRVSEAGVELGCQFAGGRVRAL